jgi:hypothetical protein
MKISVRVLIIAALLCGVFVILSGIGSCKNSIRGKVKGDAVQGVVMELSGDASLSTKTSVNGKYKFKGLVKGGYTITPGKEGYLFFPRSRSVLVDEDKAGIDFASGAAMDSISGASIKPF